MRPSPSSSTPLSSVSRSPYASFFNLNIEKRFGDVFRCGCTSDVKESQSPESQMESLQKQREEHKRSRPQHSLVVVCNPSEEVVYEEDDETETAKEYFERVSKQMAIEEAIDEALEKANHTKILHSPCRRSQQHEKQQKTERSGTAGTIFRLVKAPANGGSSRRSSHNRFSSIKHTDSDSTMSTQALSEDEDEHDERDMPESAEEQKEEEPEEDGPFVPTSILRRKKKDDGCAIAPTGRSVRFCPKTVFPHPNQKRKKVRRLPRANSYYETEREHRRLERRAQQRIHPKLSHELRSPGSDVLITTESFYVFR